MQKAREFSKVITKTVEALSVASDIEQITRIVADTARYLTQSDGTTFVLREEGKCYYADENAISPLWKGRRFAIEACISGWSMINRKVVSIRDIYQDPRIPHDAYRPTFVKSLCMVPIRSASPIGAIGNYWSKEYVPSAGDIKQLQILADCAGVAIENWELKQTVERRNSEKSKLSERQNELETSIHTLVHDLRNPIASILAFTDLLKGHLGSDLDERSISYFESISRTAGRVSQTIGQMLALYKLTSFELKKQPTDLSIITMEIESQLRAQEPDRSIRVFIDEHMIADTDPLLIRLALENLLVNAYKFTSTKDKAEIHFGKHSSNEREEEFFVTDNGVGFDAADAHKLFRPLGRLHELGASGTGLGLASVAQIINAHGGSVRAEGRPERGASFYFTIPKPDMGVRVV